MYMYGDHVWIQIISKEFWKKNERIEKMFLEEELRLKIKTPYYMMSTKEALYARLLCWDTLFTAQSGRDVSHLS